MGIVTIEDFEGAGELALFDDDWARWQGKLSQGCSVFVRLKSVKRYRDSNIYDLNVQSVDFLQDVAKNNMETLTIHINLDTIYGHVTKDAAESADGGDNEGDTEEKEAEGAGNVLADLATIIADSKGETKLMLSVRDSRLSPMPVRLASKLQGVKVNRRLVDFVKSHDGITMTL